MWSHLPFLIVYAHATGLAWDEIIPITLIGLTIVAGLVLFFLARRFKPGDEEQEAGENR
jgi:predicted permease